MLLGNWMILSFTQLPLHRHGKTYSFALAFLVDSLIDMDWISKVWPRMPRFSWTHIPYNIRQLFKMAIFKKCFLPKFLPKFWKLLEILDFFSWSIEQEWYILACSWHHTLTNIYKQVTCYCRLVNYYYLISVLTLS